MGTNWHVVEGLYELNMSTYEPFRALAATDDPIKVSDTEYEVALRDDAKFSDGTDVTSADVIESYKRASAEGNLYRPMLSFIADVTAKDSSTVTITLKQPFSLVKERLSLIKIIPASSTAEEMTKMPIGTGPWKYDSITEQEITFSPNEHYNGLFPAEADKMVTSSTDARRDEIANAAAETVAGRVPLVMGAIDTQPARVIEQAKRCEAVGADAIVVTAPFYGLGGPDQVERHFRVIAEAINTPLYAYDLPVSVHTKLDPAMLVRLGVDGVLAGVKDSSGDDVSFRRLVLANRDAGSPLNLLTGHEIVVDGAYLSGADGSVPGLGNVDPFGYIRQWNAFQAGDWDTVRFEQDRLARLMEITSVVTGVTGFGAGVGAFKTALMLLGVFTSNKMPEPVPTLTGANVEAIAEVLRAQGLLD